MQKGTTLAEIVPTTNAGLDIFIKGMYRQLEKAESEVRRIKNLIKFAEERRDSHAPARKVQ